MLYEVITHGDVGLAAKGIQATDDIGQVVRQVFLQHQLAVVVQEVVGAAPGNDQDAVAAAAVGRLDDEFAGVTDQVGQVRRLTVELDHGDKVRYREPDSQIGFLGGGWLTMGMLLSLPMVLAGAVVMTVAYRKG